MCVNAMPRKCSSACWAACVAVTWTAHCTKRETCHMAVNQIDWLARETANQCFVSSALGVVRRPVCVSDSVSSTRVPADSTLCLSWFDAVHICVNHGQAVLSFWVSKKEFLLVHSYCDAVCGRARVWCCVCVLSSGYASCVHLRAPPMCLSTAPVLLPISRGAVLL